MTDKLIFAERARELLDYDPETGIIRWRASRGAVRAGAEAGCVGQRGYRQITIDGRQYKAHRLAFLIQTGRWPHDQLDHEDHDRANNRWKNLREANNQVNHCNTKRPSNNTSGYTGVRWCKRDRKWQARIRVNGRDKSLGYFDDLAAAIAARRAAERRHGFHENHGRAA